MATVLEKEKKTDQTSSADTNTGSSDPKRSRKPILFGVLGVIVLLGLVMGIRFVTWSSTHVSTDDASIAADVVNIAPQVTGTVIKVAVSENQHVKKGDVLVQLDPSSFETAVAQAQANLDFAEAQAKGAIATVELTQQSSKAQTTQAQGAIHQTQGGTFSSYADVARANAAVSQAEAQVGSAVANYYGAQSNIAIAVAGRQKAFDAISGASAQLETAKAALNTAKANVDAAVATAANAAKQAVRNETLFRQGAVSGQVYDSAKAAADVAKAQVAATQQQVAQAEAVVLQHQSDLRAAKNQLPAATAAVAQAQAMLRASEAQTKAAKDAVIQYRAQAQSAHASVSQAKARQVDRWNRLILAPCRLL